MRFANKVVALSLATVAGPLLAIAAHQIGNGASYGSADRDDGDGVIVGSVNPTPQNCYTDANGENWCDVFGPGSGGSSGGGGGSGGGTGCPSGTSPHVQLGCETGGGSGGDPPPPEPCLREQIAAAQAQNQLSQYSPTARALMQAAIASGTKLQLIRASNSGLGRQTEYDPSANVIYWDPFQGARGFNSDNSLYVLAPIMILAHELVHAGNRHDPRFLHRASEPLVMPIANQIAREMNASPHGSNYATFRDNHDATSLFYTESSTSAVQRDDRPSCSLIE